MEKILEIRRERSFFSVVTETGTYEISGELLRQHHLAEGMQADAQLLEELHCTSRKKRAYQRALYLLDGQDYSYSMLYRKLMQTYRDKDLCIQVLQKLLDAGSIDDRRYAQHLTESLITRKKYGVYRVRQELYRRGIPKDIAEEALEGWEDAQEENIGEVLARKYGRYLTDPYDRKARDKVTAGMIRLGYSYKGIKNAIEEYFAETD